MVDVGVVVTVVVVGLVLGVVVLEKV